MSDQGHEIRSLLAAFDTSAAGFTICEVSKGVRLTGLPFEGVSALQVMTGTLRLTQDDETTSIAGPGRMVFVPPSTPFEFGACASAEPRRIDGRASIKRRGPWLVADATDGRAPNLIVAAARIGGSAQSRLKRLIVTEVGRSSAGRQALSILREETANADAGSAALAVTLMNACIVLGLRSAMAESEVRSGERDRNARIARVVSAITARPGDDYSVASLAAMAGMSRATFARQFIAVTKISPMGFVLQGRLKEAAAILRSTTMPIKSVASAVGFVDRSHFSRAFRATYDLDPSKYREQAARESAESTAAGAAQSQSGDHEAQFNPSKWGQSGPTNVLNKR